MPYYWSPHLQLAFCTVAPLRLSIAIISMTSVVAPLFFSQTPVQFHAPVSTTLKACPLFCSVAISTHPKKKMSQDELTGFGLENMPMTFGSVGSASTAVDGFDSTMDMSILLLSNISNDEPVSPRNHTSGTFDNDSLPRGMFFDNSLPLTPTTFTFSHSDQNIPDLINPLADEPIDRVVSLSPTCEGRDHEFYRRGPEADGFYHCPFGDCDFPPKVLKCEYQ